MCLFKSYIVKGEKMNRFSIIVPIYNVEKYIKNCIKSVLQQEYKDYELILVNDGSTDSSLEICNKYAVVDNRIKIYTKDNGRRVIS